MFVIDASVALAWCFEDESTGRAEELLKRVLTEGCAAPAIWPTECVNILLVAERRKRVTAADVEKNIIKLQSLDVEIDPEMAERSFSDIFALARQHGLTSYDAAYLELAARRKLPLATKDADLKSAAQKIGVAVICI
ncbi:MAG: type II toxin-antitoxin system VapC family toxin [Rhodospirillaceae bacterium]|nr:type II toxin-antitoxin system VapC family toxin [Rhodospirillaceae bacterium]